VAPNGIAERGAACPFSGVKQKSDLGSIRSAFDPKETSYGCTMGFFVVRLRLSLHDRIDAYSKYQLRIHQTAELLYVNKLIIGKTVVGYDVSSFLTLTVRTWPGRV
jgi:hypothetical protein